MQVNDTPSAQTSEVVRAQPNGAAQALEPATSTSRRPTNGRQKTPPAPRKPRKSANTPAAATSDAPVAAAIAAETCISPQVPPPGALAGLYRDFLREWEHSRTLPQHPAYTPSFDLAALTLDAISNLDEVYNRELSWLDFNWRVLHEAIDARTPLLERLKFIAITASNLDEYFSKRVGGLKRQKAAGMANLTLDGWAPDVQLSLIARASAW
jgi:Polyphosphate kinase N-terminal domain